MASTVHLLHVFFVISCTLLLATASPPPSPPPTASPSPSPVPTCTDELVLFSPCLSYVAYPPNDLTDAADANCCNAISAAAKSGSVLCFCYLLREPPILGFPLNSTRLLSLSSDCLPLANRESATARSLNSVCSESPALPPLNNSATLGLTVPSTSGSGSGGRGASSQAKIPSKPGGGGRGGGSRGGSSGGSRGGGNGSRPQRRGSSGALVGGGGNSGESSSSSSHRLATTFIVFSAYILHLLLLQHQTGENFRA